MNVIMFISLLILACYCLIKSRATTREKWYSFASMIFLLLVISPIWYERLFDFMIGVSLFLPFVLGMLGAIFGWQGIKGSVRWGLNGLNALALVFYTVVFLAGTIGFKEP